MKKKISILDKPKTKIVATAGPASSRKTVLRKIMKYASAIRVNLAHGSMEDKEKLIELVRKVSESSNANISLLADLPGPKMRLGKLERPVNLKRGEKVVLFTCKGERSEKTEKQSPDEIRIPVEYEDFPRIVSKGDKVYLCDGTIKLRVEEKTESEVVCTVLCGGTVTSRRGINVPGSADVPVPTEEDVELLRAFGDRVDAVGISFVGSREDVERVRKLTNAFLIAKIERGIAVKNIDGILDAADGIMVARGDLGVEMPIEELAVLQKRLILKANLASKPVITATQMLESMIADIRPTRAEATDVANAILDGSDALMLSEETAIGKYPVEAVETMAAIARFTEDYREEFAENRVLTIMKKTCSEKKNAVDAIALAIIQIMKCLDIDMIIARTRSGRTARCISRFKPSQWIFAFTPEEKVCKELNFSYGVIPFAMEDRSDKNIVEFLRDTGVSGKAVITEEVRLDENVRVGTNAVKIFNV